MYCYLLLQLLKQEKCLLINDDPLFNVIEDLTKLTTEPQATFPASMEHTHTWSDKTLEQRTISGCNDGVADEIISSPDSLEAVQQKCKRPIPPPRTKVPLPLSTNSSSENGYEKQRSESDHEILMTLGGSGGNYHLLIL